MLFRLIYIFFTVLVLPAIFQSMYLMAMCWVAGVRFPGGASFLFTIASIPTMGPTRLSIQRVPKALSPWVRRQGREADHSPPSRAEVKNGGAIPPTAHTPR
jgi:hypothetical protein